MSTTSLTLSHKGKPMSSFLMAELREAAGNGSAASNASPSLDLAEVLAAVQAAVKAVAATLRSSGLVKWRNAREIATEIFINYLGSSHSIVLLICDDKVIPVEVGGDRRGKYVVCISPLDSKHDSPDPPCVAGSVFSVHRYLEARSAAPGPPGPPAGRPSLRAVLQPGRNLVAAGYSLYGSSTLLVLTTGPGVHLFVLDPMLGEFILTAANLTIPGRGHMYSVDEGLTYEWRDPVVEYVESKKDPKLGSTYSSHHMGCTVADVHNVLRNGGIYLSPQTRSNPSGKLRLVLEAAPLAHLVCRAGGLATDGQSALTDCQPEGLAHRTAAFLGSREDVRDLLAKFRRSAPYSTRTTSLRAHGVDSLLSTASQLGADAGGAKDQKDAAKRAAAAEAGLSASVAALSATIVAYGSKATPSRPTSAVYSSSTGSVLGLMPAVQRPVSAVSAPSSPSSSGGGAASPSSLAFAAVPPVPHAIPHAAKKVP